MTQAISYEPEYGRPDTITDHRGNTTIFGYDSRGNRTSQWPYAVNDPTTPTTSARWSYDHPDLAGNTAVVTDPKGQSTGYVDDSLNRVTETCTPGGRLSRLIYPSGRVVDIQRSESTCSISGVSN